MHKKGISLNSVEKISSHSADKIHRKTHLFRKYLVSKSFKQKRGEASRFCRKSFISQYRKISLGNISVYQKISGSEKFYASERGGIKFLRRKLFVTQYRKISLGNTSVYQKISCITKFYAQEGVIPKLRRKIFVSQCR